MKIRKAKLPDAEYLSLLYLQFWESIKNNDPLLRLAKNPSLKIEQAKIGFNEISKLMLMKI